MPLLDIDYYKDLFNLNPYPLLVLRPDAPVFTIIDVNNSYLEIYHFKKREDVVGKGIQDVWNTITPGGAERLIWLLRKVVETRKAESLHMIRWDLPAGDSLQMETKYWDVSGIPIIKEKDDLQYVLFALQDITETAKVEQDVRKAKEETEFQRGYLRSVFLQAPLGIGIYRGPKFVVDLINPFLAEFFDRKDEEVIGRPFFEVIDEAAGMGWEKVLHKVLYTGIPYIGQEHPVILNRKGQMQKFYLNFIIYPYYEADGTISGVIKISIDVTKQVLLRKELEENEQRMKLAVESADLSVWHLNLKTRRVLTSRELPLKGFPKAGEEWTIEEYLNLILPEDREFAMSKLAEAERTGKFSLQVRVKLENDSIHWVQGTGRVYNDENNEPSYIIGTTLDITDRKELDRRKDDLITTVSHELKTPVTSIKGIAQVLERKFSNSEDQVTSVMLRRMVIQLQRLTLLIQDLLDVSKIEGGKLLLKKSNFFFDELVLDIVSEVERTDPSHKIIIGNSESIECFTDKERVGQVLSNLLNNAIKYSPGKDEVRVSMRAEDNNVICCIQDFGIGIPYEKQKHIFDRFYRVIEERNYAFQGIGLGLYISAEIIKRLDGEIWFDSKPGKGSTFCFSIPIKSISVSSERRIHR